MNLRTLGRYAKQATRAVLGSNGTRTVFLPGSAAPGMLMNVAQ